MYLDFEATAILNIFSFIYIKVTRISRFVSVYHRPLNFATKPVPATFAWLKNTFQKYI